MSIRAKFKVEYRTESVAGFQIMLSPVTTGSKENEQFYKWTPGGKIELTTVNKDAGEQFKPGVEFYVDFTPAEQK
jgi:hypothetical protein